MKGNTTRPTTDRVKESLFNIIANYVPAAEVLDLFAGTGNLGIESLSRGANSAVFVDKTKECIQVIKENLQHTKLMDKATLLTGDAKHMLNQLGSQGKKFDLIFLDPPYHKNLVVEALQAIIDNAVMNENCLIAVERDKEDEIPEIVGPLQLVRNQKYGDTILSFYKYTQTTHT